MQIQIDDVKQVAELLFKHLEELDIQSLELPVDYYWNIEPDELYEVGVQPSAIDVGQLSDDWGDLQKVMADPDRALAHDFVDLAAILNAIGHHVIG